MSEEQDDKTLATFRVENQIWEAFKQKSKKQGMNASSVLNQFIKTYVAKDLIKNEEIDISNETITPHLEQAIEDKINTYLAQHLDKLVAKSLKNCFGKVIDN